MIRRLYHALSKKKRLAFALTEKNILHIKPSQRKKEGRREEEREKEGKERKREGERKR